MKRILVILAIVACFAPPVFAETRWDRAIYPDNCSVMFHVTPASASYYTDLTRKYGGDYVYQFSDYTTLDVIEGRIISGQNACILFYPGSYAFSDAWTVAKEVTIMGATGNPDDVNLDGDTSNVDIIIFANGSDGSTIKNVRMTLDNATTGEEDAITIQSGADGVMVDNVTFTGSATASTDAQGVTIAANRCQVKNSRFVSVSVDSGAINITGNDAVIENNIFIGTKASMVAIDVNSANTASAGLRTVLRKNIISYTAASSDIGIKTASNALNNIYSSNQIKSADPISSGTGNTTLHLFENVTSNVTSAAWITN